MSKGISFTTTSPSATATRPKCFRTSTSTSRRGKPSLSSVRRAATIRNADEIIVITPDGIRERGSHAELLKRDGLYAKYYNMQFEGLN